MRIKSVETENFAGLGSIKLEGLDTRKEVFISGRNGMGKSQLLLAIALVSRRDFYPSSEARKYIMSGFSDATLTVEFRLDQDEVRLVNEACRQWDSAFNVNGDVVIGRLRLFGNREREHQWEDTSGQHLPAMQDMSAGAQLPFTDVIYLPADRIVRRTSDLTLSLSSLTRSATTALAHEMINQQISDTNQLSTFDVFSSLAALHYAGMLQSQERSGESPQARDFVQIVDAFERATGKHIDSPALDSEGNIVLRVEVPGRMPHSVNTLSSGELIALQLLHFVKLHRRQGSILLLDEPEQHLHPSLQVEIASFADSEIKRLALFDELGVAPGLWVPGNFMVIVEGPTDEAYLRKLLPEEMGLAYFLVAGNSSSVKSIADRMTGESVPFIAIRDRDRAPTMEREKWNASPSRFMWSGYSIESLFLDAHWIHQTLAEMSESWTAERINKELERVYGMQYSSAREQWYRDEINRRVSSTPDHTSSLHKFLQKSAALAQERLNMFVDESKNWDSDFDNSWKAEPLRFVEPKRALGEFHQDVYKGRAMLEQAMISRLRRGDARQPLDLTALRSKIQDLRKRTANDLRR